MKIKPQKTQELTHLGELIEDMRVCMLTTIDDADSMVARPMSPVEMCEAGAIWFLTDPHTTKAQHLNLINLAFSDESNATYVSISGNGEIVEDKVLIERFWTPMAKPWFPEGVESSNLALLKFVPHSAEYWDSPNSKMVRMFAMIASIVAAKPIGMGDHGSLNTL